MRRVHSNFSTSAWRAVNNAVMVRRPLDLFVKEIFLFLCLLLLNLFLVAALPRWAICGFDCSFRMSGINYFWPILGVPKVFTGKNSLQLASNCRSMGSAVAQWRMFCGLALPAMVAMSSSRWKWSQFGDVHPRSRNAQRLCAQCFHCYGSLSHWAAGVGHAGL